MQNRIREAEIRLKKLKEQGHKEADELNKQYEELKKRATAAAQALFDFEREKLGMREAEEKDVVWFVTFILRNPSILLEDFSVFL